MTEEEALKVLGPTLGPLLRKAVFAATDNGAALAATNAARFLRTIADRLTVAGASSISLDDLRALADDVESLGKTGAAND